MVSRAVMAGMNSSLCGYYPDFPTDRALNLLIAESSLLWPVTKSNRDFPYIVTNNSPARYDPDNTTTSDSISTPLTIRQPAEHVNSLKIYHFGTFSTHSDHGFLIIRPDFRSVAGHPVPTSPGLDLNRPILSRISPKSAFGTTNSVIWNTTYRECLSTLVPILMRFSRSVLNDHFFADSGNGLTTDKTKTASTFLEAGWDFESLHNNLAHGHDIVAYDWDVIVTILKDWTK